MSFDAAQIQQGNRVRAELKSQPATFAMDSGVPKITPGKNLQANGSTRMAGQMGARALELMQDQNEAARTNQWMEMFGQSNQGAEFNQTKQMQASQVADAQLANEAAQGA